MGIIKSNILPNKRLLTRKTQLVRDYKYAKRQFWFFAIKLANGLADEVARFTVQGLNIEVILHQDCQDDYFVANASELKRYLL